MQATASAKPTQKPMTRAERIWDHARKCKKTLDDCVTCNAGIQYFAELPLGVLAHTLQENTIRTLTRKGRTVALAGN
jgi:hypothetical protein